MADKDPNLINKLNSNKDREPLKVILTLNKQSEDQSQDVILQKETLKKIIDSAENSIQEKPISVSHLPFIRTVMIEGSTRFVRQLINDKEISVITLSQD